MAQDIVSGLFGLSPNQVAQQQQQQINMQAQNYAQQDPFQRATSGMYQTGAGIGGIGAGMLGMVNPEVEAAKQRESMLGQIDMSTPEGILQGAELARQRGDIRMQIQLQALAEQRKNEMVDSEFKSAQAAAQRAKINQPSPSSSIGKLMADRAQARASGDIASVKAYDAMIRKETMVKGGDGAAASSDAQAKPATKLSSIEQKELFEADDIVQASQNVQSQLNDALTLNDKAYSGYGAKERALVRSNLPGESQSANATIELDNLMTGQALESLKAVFGGMPTEGERKILLEMQASADKTPTQRKAIITRAIAMAKRREELNASKAEKLRSGEYVRPGGAPSTPNSGGWAIRPKK